MLISVYLIILTLKDLKVIKQFILVILVFGAIGCCNYKTGHNFSRNDFPDVLNIHNTPSAPVDWNSFCFSDKGAWFGFALPDPGKTGFAGPFLMTNGKWLSKSIINLNFYDENSNLVKYQKLKSVYYPGKLIQELIYNDFKAIVSLIFTSSETALVHVEFTDIKKQTAVMPEWSGSIFKSEGKILTKENNILIKGYEYNTEIKLAFQSNDIVKFNLTDTTYSLHFPLTDAEENNSFSMLVSFNDDRCHKKSNIELEESILNKPSKYLSQNEERWNNYIHKALQTNASWGDKKEYQNIAVKSVQTLINNWRSAYGDLLHDGLFPSYAVWYFNGFWAWDSWKHAVALVKFEPELAKNQVRTMFDYQNTTGMVADCIYADSTENNWLNTKPPLAGWAIWEVFKEIHDTSFVQEMYPKLLKYHEWWYRYRDLNHNKLCEYGSSDGSLVAAKWESGMDNAIRFDSSAIAKIDANNYAFSQESVDLNSYLYLEKLLISKMADLLDKTEIAEQYKTEAEELKQLVESFMFDKITGYYYDVNLQTQRFILVQGPEGWSPLFTGLASEEKAKQVIQIMTDTTKFATYIPFPTAPKDDPKFSEAYWRGPIWLDQVYFAISALENYAYHEEAKQYTLQVFDGLEGLKEQAPIRENYWPLDGKGMRVNHFSWSAAHLLLLYRQNFKPS